jgi:WD40 repeat protein
MVTEHAEESESEEEEVQPRPSTWARLGRWRLLLLAILPLALAWVVAERASWRPRVLPGPRANVFQVAWSPQGETLAVAAQNDVMEPLPAWTPSPGDHYGGPQPQRKLDDAVDLWEADGRTLRHRINLPGESLGSIAFSPDGRLLAGLVTRRNQGERSMVKMWDVRSGKLARSLRVPGAFPMGLYWTEPEVISFTERSRGLVQYSARTGRQRHALGSFYGHDWTVLSPDDKTLARLEDGGVDLRDIRTGERRHWLHRNRDPEVVSVAFSVDGAFVLGACPEVDRSAVRLWRVSDGKLQQRLRFSFQIGPVAMSPDASIAAVKDDRGAIQLWRLRDGRLLRTIPDAPQPYEGSMLAFSPDGATLARTAKSGVRLWRIK